MVGADCFPARGHLFFQFSLRLSGRSACLECDQRGNSMKAYQRSIVALVLACLIPGCATNKLASQSSSTQTACQCAEGCQHDTGMKWWELALLPPVIASVVLLKIATAGDVDDDCE